jgi:hypothetical protein
VAVGVGFGGVGVRRATTAGATESPQATDPTFDLDAINFVTRPPLAGTELTTEERRPTDTNVRVRPSGAQTGDCSFEEPGVIFRCPPPLDAIVYIAVVRSLLDLRLETNAIERPFGDHDGSVELAATLVRRLVDFPVVPIV